MYSSSVCGLSILGVPFAAVLHPSLCLSVRNAIDQNRVREQRRSLFVRAVSTWKINSMCVCVREIEGERERAIVRSSERERSKRGRYLEGKKESHTERVVDRKEKVKERREPKGSRRRQTVLDLAATTKENG